MQNSVQYRNVVYAACLFLVLCSFHHVSSLQPCTDQLQGGEEDDTASHGCTDDTPQLQPRYDDDDDDTHSYAFIWAVPLVFLCTVIAISLTCTFAPCCPIYKRRKAYKNLLVSTTVIHSVQRTNPPNQVQNSNYPTQNVQNSVLYASYSNHPQRQHDPNTPYYDPQRPHDPNTPYYVSFPPYLPPAPSAPNPTSGGNPPFYPPPQYGQYPPPSNQNTQVYQNEPPPRYLPQETTNKATY